MAIQILRYNNDILQQLEPAVVPAGMLQFPVYEWTLPHYTNFGVMGGLVGHYLVHAIDTWGKENMFTYLMNSN